ncbi:MAG TPA: hypothetical protein DCQ76_02375 [Ruminococcaceae bacterium]|nr:hypothetical protein [Oscillospiraceae bacterium]
MYQGFSAFFNSQNATRFYAILCYLRLFKRKNASQMQVKIFQKSGFIVVNLFIDKVLILMYNLIVIFSVRFALPRSS